MGGTVICRIRHLAANATATITLVVRPTEPGVLHDTAAVTATNVIPDADDSSTAPVTARSTA